MSIEKLRKGNKANGIIRGYRRALAEELADEVIENWSKFGNGSSVDADKLLEKFYCRFVHIQAAEHAIENACRMYRRDIEVRNKDVKLGEYDFLCFVCRNIVGRNDSKCSECGWTWDL